MELFIGQLHLPEGNMFYLDGYKKGNSFFLGKNWLELNSINFPNIVFNYSTDDNFDCLSAQFDPDSDVLQVVSNDCEKQNEVICRVYSYFYLHTVEVLYCIVMRPSSYDNMNYFEMLFNPILEEGRHKIHSKMKAFTMDMVNRLDQHRAYDSLLSTLWYAYFPCFDLKHITAMRDGDSAIIKYCEWKGIAISCSAIFSSYPTDQGMCCSFNMKAADEIYHSGPYSKIITDLQAAATAAAFANSSKPYWYLRASEPSSIPGRNKGLFLILDAHSDMFTISSQDNDFDGFFGLINPSGTFPLMALEGFEIKLGHLNSVSLTATRVDADDDMNDVDINDRKCLFSYENSNLLIFKEYSYSNCMFECQIIYVREKV